MLLNSTKFSNTFGRASWVGGLLGWATKLLPAKRILLPGEPPDESLDCTNSRPKPECPGQIQIVLVWVDISHGYTQNAKTALFVMPGSCLDETMPARSTFLISNCVTASNY